MTKFSDEFRLKAIRMVKDGYGLECVSKKLGISKSYLSRLRKHYESGGVSQILTKNRSYSPNFKKKVVEYKWKHGLSLNQTMTLFKIPDCGTVFQWEKRYLAQGISGLMPRKKGRPSKMTPKTPKKPRDLTREEELEAEIAQLKMENAFLKKLNALVQARKKQQKKS